MRCLYCGNGIVSPISWKILFSKEEDDWLCEECKGQIVRIEGDCCIRCSRPFTTLSKEYCRGDLCYDCVRWEGDPQWCGILESNKSFSLYNDFQKEFISRFKFRGDYVLVKTFVSEMKSMLKECEYDLLVPVPLSKERLYQRGFNQAEALIVEAGLSPTFALRRSHTEKQSKKSRKERIHIDNVFMFNPELNVRGKKIVLIDDIYTTGSTVMHAAKVLKQQGGADSVLSITVARG